MRSIHFLLFCCAIILSAHFCPALRAEAKDVKLLHHWKGSVDNEALQKAAPECITTAKGLEKLRRAWLVEGKLPEIDFTKEIAVITTGNGSKLDLIARLDDKGNLEAIGFGTRDLLPGFRYVIAIVSREGVKTVNKKALPSE